MIALNGESSDLRAGETVAAVLIRLGLQSGCEGRRGGGRRRGRPARRVGAVFALGEGARVEVLTAMQGG